VNIGQIERKKLTLMWIVSPVGGAGVGDLVRLYPIVFWNSGCPLMRGSSSLTVDQLGNPLIFLLGLQLSWILTVHDRSMGDNEVAAALKWLKEVDCKSVQI
jgi:hypothetical protein